MDSKFSLPFICAARTFLFLLSKRCKEKRKVGRQERGRLRFAQPPPFGPPSDVFLFSNIFLFLSQHHWRAAFIGAWNILVAGRDIVY